MSIRDRIQELQSIVGAQSAEPLPPGEVVAFNLRDDGDTSFMLADGTTTYVPSADNLRDLPDAIVARHRAVCAEILRRMVDLVPGNTLRAGVTYYRRQIAIGEQKFSAIFTEAGR